MAEYSSRFKVPLLVPGQGQKDITHNESIEIMDSLLHALIESRSLQVPPDIPAIGQCWLIPAAASGAWFEHDGGLAFWTAGGWRFVRPAEGYTAWLKAEGRRIRLTEQGWHDEPPFEAALGTVVPPSGGLVVDAEARAAISAILLQLAGYGLVDMG